MILLEDFHFVHKNRSFPRAKRHLLFIYPQRAAVDISLGVFFASLGDNAVSVTEYATMNGLEFFVWIFCVTFFRNTHKVLTIADGVHHFTIGGVEPAEKLVKREPVLNNGGKVALVFKRVSFVFAGFRRVRSMSLFREGATSAVGVANMPNTAILTVACHPTRPRTFSAFCSKFLDFAVFFKLDYLVVFVTDIPAHTALAVKTAIEPRIGIVFGGGVVLGEPASRHIVRRRRKQRVDSALGIQAVFAIVQR